MKKLLKKLKEDRGDSSLLSTMLASLLIFILTVTLLDVGIFLLDRGTVNTIARDGARSVAIMGGSGTSSEATPIENQYGRTKAEACKIPQSKGMNTGNKTPIECAVMTELSNSSALIRVEINDVTCTPSVTTKMSDDTLCTVSWTYNPLPAAALSVIPVVQKNITSGNAQSEVALDPNSLQPRR